MTLPLFMVDAFTTEPFKGNPAAVCLLDKPRDDAWMQSVAAEMNLSETAFLLKEQAHYRLRWFTPSTEVDLCGHATLASAHILWETNSIPRKEPARFETLSGRLTCTFNNGWIEMDFPAEPPAPCSNEPELRAALGSNSFAAPPQRNRMDFLIELTDEQAVRAFTPDLAAIAKLPARALTITARSADPQFDFVSRFFGPAVGVPEDPVTGSAHCCLGPYWSAKLGKSELIGHQVSTRGGIIRVAVQDERVILSGQAMTFLAGHIR